MVKKLIKHEFIYYIRTLVIFLPIMLIAGITVRITQLLDSESIAYGIILGSSMTVLVFATVASILLTTVLAVVRFYKNMYTAEGYLTFTLPVNNHQHVLAKLVAYIVCNIVSAITIFLAWLIALSGFGIDWNTVLSEVAVLFKSVSTTHLVFYIIEIIILIFVALTTSPLLYYACISIGQLAKKNRILLAVGAYYGNYLIGQFLSTIFMIAFSTSASMGLFESIVSYIENNAYTAIHIIFSIGIILNAGLGALYYFITIYIMNNKLNLE